MTEESHQPKESDQPGKLPFSRDDVLRSSNQDVYHKISNLAIQLAILGYTDTASNLIGKLNKHDWFHGLQTIIRPLNILWDQIGHWPDGEKDRIRESIQNERKRAAEKKVKNEQGEETGKKVKLEVDESPITDEDIKKEVDDMYHSYAKCWWYPELPHLWAYPGVYVPPSPHDQSVELSVEELRKRIQDLISAVHHSGVNRPVKEGEPLSPSAALVSALELRIKLKERDGSNDGVPSEHEILEMIARRLNERSQISDLIQSRRAWPMLRDGSLLEILAIDKSKVDLFAHQLEDAVTARLQKGKQLLPERPIKELLDTINKNTLTNPDSLEMYHGVDLPVPTTILHSPASASLITSTEARLGTTLPNDYKEYLRITNGNAAAFGGIIPEAPLWKCEDIRWMTDDEDYFPDATVDIPGYMAGIMHKISGDGLDWPKLGRGIIIGQEDIDQTFLIPPETVQHVREKVRSILDSKDENVTQEVKVSVERAVEDFAASMQEWEQLEWCCFTWASDGGAAMDGYKSFKAYLEHVAQGSGRKESEKDCWNLGYMDFFGDMLRGEDGGGA